MLGCLEHTGVVIQLIRKALEGKGDLTVLWLDLAYAYLSIPHRVWHIRLVSTQKRHYNRLHSLSHPFSLIMIMVVQLAEVECRTL